MNENAQNLLRQLDEEIAQRVALKESIQKCFGIAVENPRPEPPLVLRPPRKQKGRAKQAVHAAGEHEPTQPGAKKAEGARRLAIIAGLPEPITAKTFAAAAGLKKKDACIALCSYVIAGKITRSGRGQYSRLNSSVSSQPPAAPVRPPRTAPVSALNNHELSGGSLERRVLVAASDPAAPQEFTAASLAVKTGLSADVTGIAIYKLMRKGYVADVSDPDDGEKYFKLTGKK